MNRFCLLAATLAVVAFPAAATGQPPDPGTTGPAWSPYLVGALLGLLSMATFYFSDNALGASGAYAGLAGLLARALGRRPEEKHEYYREKPPRVEWEIMLLFGVVAGAWLAAWTGNEITARWLPPMWIDRFGTTVPLRLLVGLAGGALMGFGARLAGGCTSGHGISGALQFSTSSWIALVCFFAGGVVTAFLLYEL